MPAAIANEASEQLSNIISEYVINIIKQNANIWFTKCGTWLNEANAYIKQNQSVAEKLTVAAKQLVQKNNSTDTTVSLLSDILKLKRVAKEKINGSEHLLIEGYRLLNEIGETIRKEVINYSVTFTTTGADIVSSHSGEVVTLLVDIDNFLKMVSFTSTRMVLQSPSVLTKMLNSQIKKDKIEVIAQEFWTEQKIQNFKFFDAQARGVQNRRWGKVNYGNTLEAYLRFIDILGEARWAEYKENTYWNEIESSMLMTMANPDPFYQGGDIGQEQVKGLNASVTNLSTLLTVINKVFIELSSSEILDIEKLKKITKSSFYKPILNASSDTAEQTAQKLLNIFKSNTIRVPISL